jgi:hypothetical protein
MAVFYHLKQWFSTNGSVECKNDLKNSWCAVKRDIFSLTNHVRGSLANEGMSEIKKSTEALISIL